MQVTPRKDELETRLNLARTQEGDGRAGSLLEVSTGFHPELTGRENTYLSDAILGMGEQEITRKFDEIVSFTEMEKSIDTPVKHYSSGMYVRLAFAVAAHLEPEILLVDEVLAVGDIRFQRKCLGKMGDVARAGRTVILVSHQLNQIRRLCQRVVVWLDGGILRQTGATAELVSAYEEDMTSGSLEDVRPVEGPAQFLRWRLIGANRTSDHILPSDGETLVGFLLRVNQTLHSVHHGIGLYDQHHHLLWGNAVDGVTLEPGLHEFRYTLPTLPLRTGVYSGCVVLYDVGVHIDDWECVPNMHVVTVPITHYRDESVGFLNIPSKLEILPADSFK